MSASATGPAGPVGGPGDVIDTTGGRRRRWWRLVPPIVVALALTWTQLGPDEPDRSRAGPEPSTARTSLGARPVSTRLGPVSQLTVAPDGTEFALQELCADGGCGRRVLASPDHGLTWIARGELAGGVDRLSALAAGSLGVLADDRPASVTRSADGGRTWADVPLSRGGPEPAPGTALVVVDQAAPCAATVCPPRLAWVDVGRSIVHALPGPPVVDSRIELAPAPRGPDGELLATGIVTTGGAFGEARVWSSVDGGRNWRVGDLMMPTPEGSRVTEVHALAAGAGRLYAVATTTTATGPDGVFAFRSDDQGTEWQPLTLPTGLGPPSAVLAGELLARDGSGLVRRSTQGARAWVSTGLLLGAGDLTQTVPAGPVLATVVDVSGLVTYYRSTDAVSWTRLRPPPV